MEVWGSDPSVPIAPQASPVRHWLHSLRSLFPAFPGPLLRMLRCLANDPASAVASDSFLKATSDLACLHEEHALVDGTVPERGSGGRFAAAAWLPVPGLTGLVIPEVMLTTW